MTESYKTITSPAEGEIIEKKSRFIARIAPVADPEEARAFIESVKKLHHDARHNCYAYILGDEGSELKYSDDGEPQGTAGRPMLEVLKGRELTFICAVVTRYFGGILLGTGGLSRAYSDALSAALDNADITTMSLSDIVRVKADYTLTGKLMHLCEKREVSIRSTEYTERVEYLLAIPPSITDSVLKDITELSGATAAFEKCGCEYSPK